ncbi:MAG: hypothetical protein HFF17_08765 [Oscillospiraceae bacterium]|nr:hypothetical protein [Oscillospiraceae bacterium]
MCRRTKTIGNILMALGAGLLLSMLIPRSFWTVLLAVVLIALGWLISQQSD